MKAYARLCLNGLLVLASAQVLAAAALRSDGAELISTITERNSAQKPAFSPDGSAIAFEDDLDVEAKRSPDGKIGAIAILSLQTGAVRRIVSDGDNRHPLWSPDGSRILLRRRTNALADGGYRLFTVNPDGSGLAHVTGTGSAVDHCDSDASWSADGQWIVESARYGASMSCRDDSGNAESKVYLVSADGSRVMQVTFEPNAQDGAPAMSPDSRWIYFESHRTAHDGGSPMQIWRIANPLPQANDYGPFCLVP